MKKYLSSHWFWLFVLLCGYSLYDFFEHVSKEGSLFEQYPSEWFLFRFSIVCAFCFALYFSSHLLYLIRLPRLLADLLAFLGALLLHLSFLGPLWNRIFWPYDAIHLKLSYEMMAIALMGYIVYRILFLVAFSVIKKLS